MSPYKLWATIVALAAAVLLVITAYVSFGPEQPVVPEVSVTAQEGGGNASAILQERTSLQKWRAVSGPSPDSRAPDAAMGPGERLSFGQRLQIPDAGQLVQSWQANRPEENLLRPSENVTGVSSLPYPQAGTFEQPGGRTWRETHNDQVRYGGGWLLFGMILALALFLAFRGRIPIAEGYSGERIERFNSVERANHWMTAVSFILMALTGLVLIYGKPLLLPLIGPDAMGSLGRWSVWLHMAFAVPFVIGILLMIGMWLGSNLPDKYDGPWLRRFGGFLSDSGDHPPARRFNTGQKLVFWGVVLGGLALLVSGVTLMFPFFWAGYDGMQWVQSVHAVVSLLMIALIFGHIYIGTVGMQDAFDAMWSGKVDRNWLKEHHSVWYEENVKKGGGKKKGSGSGSQPQPAE